MDIIKELIDIELKFVSGIGDTNFLILLFLFLGALILYLYKKKIESFLLLLSGGSFIFSAIIKNLFKEVRPVTAQNYMFFEKYSFPSSHTVTYTAVFGYILYLTYKLSNKDKFVTNFIRMMCIYFIALVGVSRVYLGQHYIRDVIAGYGFGCLYLAFVLYVEKKLKQKKELKKVKALGKNQNNNN